MTTPRAHHRSQGFDITNEHFYEGPSGDSECGELWCFTDKLSYAPGDTVSVHAASRGGRFTLSARRDGGVADSLATIDGLNAPVPELAPDFASAGCGWPCVARFEIPSTTPSGFYILEARGVDGLRQHRHGFFVRAREPSRERILLIAATSTWIAYNDWGGANAYYHAHDDSLPFATHLSVHRPWANGFVDLPRSAPRKPHAWRPAPNEPPRYPPIEFAYARGLSKWYANAGWASYERPFAHWAEAQGFGVDYATQHDLHSDPHLLDGYACAVVVGHDEYWSWEMRDAIDAFVERGGRFARFGGNIAWQVRLENNGETQVCYKDLAAERDPLRGADQRQRLTSIWDDPAIGRPAAQTFGLTAIYGIYAGVGALAARSGGFATYRPEHWAFANTGLGYGDVFGEDARIFGYEVDGLDYVVRDGLPYPTFKDGAPDTTRILAMGLASNREHRPADASARLYYGDSSEFLARWRYGRTDAEARDAASRGSGMIVHFTRGAGEVLNAGSSEWVAGLALREPFTEQITRNVLDRFLSGGAS